MGSKNLFNRLLTGDGLPTDQIATYRFPTVPSTIVAAPPDGVVTNCVTPRYVVSGPTRRAVTLTLTALSLTVADATVGVGVKLLDFLSGSYRIQSVRASLTFTTTSVLADTLNLSKVINWALGTTTQTTATLKGTAESDLLQVTAATSSATVNVANAATYGERLMPRGLDGSVTAPDVYLNISVPTSSDIDADATVAVNGTIEIIYDDLGLNSAASAQTRMWSPGLWANCPWTELERGETFDGFTYWNDFVAGHYTQAANVAASATTIRDGGMCAFTGATAGGTVAPATDAPYGVVKLLQTTDGETTCLQALGNGNIAGQVVFEAGKRVWAEFRVKVANITTNEHGCYFGFGEEGLVSAAGVISAADALADKDFIGFFYTAVATTACGTVVNTAGGGGITTVAASAATFAADTWTNLGIYCDGTTIYFYQDGVQLAASVALSATNVPDGEEMAFYLALVTGSGGGDCIASIDWLRVAQQRA